MIETIAIGALSLTTIGAGYQWFMAHMERRAFKALNELLHEDLAEALNHNRAMGKFIAELTMTNFKLLAEKRRRDAPLRRQTEKNKADAKARKAAEQAARDARHAEMRDSLGVI